MRPHGVHHQTQHVVAESVEVAARFARLLPRNRARRNRPRALLRRHFALLLPRCRDRRPGLDPASREAVPTPFWRNRFRSCARPTSPNLSEAESAPHTNLSEAESAPQSQPFPHLSRGRMHPGHRNTAPASKASLASLPASRQSGCHLRAKAAPSEGDLHFALFYRKFPIGKAST